MTDNVTLVRNAFAGNEKGDFRAILDILDDDIEWYEAVNHPYWTGHAFRAKDDIRKHVLERGFIDFAELLVVPERIVGFGDTVLAEAVVSGTAKATGKSFETRIAQIWDFRNGKVVRWRLYADTWLFVNVLAESPHGTGGTLVDKSAIT